MLKSRLIAVLFLMDGMIVQSKKFHEHKVIGNPVEELARFSEWGVDELVYLDISRKPDFPRTLAILERVANHAFMPLTFGGNIKTLDQIGALIQGGADKVLINTAAFKNRDVMIREASRKFGSQAVVAGIDTDGDRIFINQGREPLNMGAVDWAAIAERKGAGEIMLNFIDRDGTRLGYDLDCIRRVSGSVNIPVIACGGAGQPEHFAEGLRAGAHAVAGGNYFHFTENAYRRAKKYLKDEGFKMR